MSKCTIIGFYGESKSGKTTLIVDIIHQLIQEGMTVAAIKITDKNIEMDTRGKDTWKYQQAGASTVVLSSESNTNIFIYKKENTEKIINLLTRYKSYDVILIEGARDKQIPKIKLGDGKERENTITHYQNNMKGVVEMIKKEIHKKKEECDISITVNGKKIPLSEFPADIISSTLLGMLSSLKGIDTIQDAIIQLKIS